MSSLIEKVTSAFGDSKNATQLAITAVAASALTAGTIFTTQKVRRAKRSKRLKQELFGLDDDDLNLPIFDADEYSASNEKEAPVTKDTPIYMSPGEEELIQEQLARNLAFFGQDGMKKVQDSFVIVVGCGGVGSWAALMLLRSGVQRIRLIDFDQVTLSSLNRHAVAVRGDVGTPKAYALKQHFARIVPQAKIEACIDMFKGENAEELLSGSPDYVLDCIDNIGTKLDLLKYCHTNGIKVISAMGAGMKADPSRIQIADIGNTFEDGLSRAVRRKLKRMGIENGIPVVYSTEKPGKVQLLSLADSQEDDPDEYAVLPDFRVRIVPVLGTMPAMFGMAMATYTLTQLAGFPTDPLPIKGRHSLYVRMHRELLVRENKAAGVNGNIILSQDDCGYILEEIWKGKSAVSGAVEKLALTRWDYSKPLSFQNCVCMTKSEANKHEALKVRPEEYYSKDVLDWVKQRFEQEREIGNAKETTNLRSPPIKYVRGELKLCTKPTTSGLLNQVQDYLSNKAMDPVSRLELINAIQDSLGRLSQRDTVIGIFGLKTSQSQRLRVLRNVLFKDNNGQGDVINKVDKLFSQLAIEEIDTTISFGNELRWEIDQDNRRAEVSIPSSLFNNQDTKFYIPSKNGKSAGSEKAIDTSDIDSILYVLDKDELINSDSTRRSIRDNLLRYRRDVTFVHEAPPSAKELSKDDINENAILIRKLIASLVPKQSDLQLPKNTGIIYIDSDKELIYNDTLPSTKKSELLLLSGPNVVEIDGLKKYLEDTFLTRDSLEIESQKKRSALTTALLAIEDVDGSPQYRKSDVSIVGQLIKSALSDRRDILDTVRRDFFGREMFAISYDLGGTKGAITQWYHQGWIWQSLLVRVNEVADNFDNIIFDKLLNKSELNIVHTTGRLNQYLSTTIKSLRDKIVLLKNNLLEDQILGYKSHNVEKLNELEQNLNKVLDWHNVIDPLRFTNVISREKQSIKDSRVFGSITSYMRLTWSAFWAIEAAAVAGPFVYTLPLEMALPASIGASILGVLFVKSRWNLLFRKQCDYLDSVAESISKKLSLEVDCAVHELLDELQNDTFDSLESLYSDQNNSKSKSFATLFLEKSPPTAEDLKKSIEEMANSTLK
ncbi:hypothetical protein H4219_000350 [Mycoemilia scoparia]|uniref:THIF-type NAD/FAD binding fold domain-containing protein n=1 Tax=Mycoemilia scoparia TaxID=417184 RepID=A0A9W8ACA3_9FUNG|nr:hypothetical protein H4219_000350 [Mycoemilia scoparia]